MKSTEEVIPWKCHICGGEFDTPRGGICSWCSRATCRTHLHPVRGNLKIDTKWVCDNCLTNGVKEEKKKTKTIKKV